jgi:branched-chain amino acid transport system permease protein
LIVAFCATLIYFVPLRLNVVTEGSLRESSITVTTMNIYYFLTLIPLVVCYFIMKRILSSPVGRIFVAVRENEDRAKMLGYDVFRYRLISSAISGVFAALAGALYAPYILSINPDSVLGVTITLNVLIYCILGGLGTLIGPMIGAGIITLLADELPSVPYIGQYWMLTLGTFYLLVILFLPYGIVNMWRLKGVTAKRKIERAIARAKATLRKEST